MERCLSQSVNRPPQAWLEFMNRGQGNPAGTRLPELEAGPRAGGDQETTDNPEERAVAKRTFYGKVQHGIGARIMGARNSARVPLIRTSMKPLKN